MHSVISEELEKCCEKVEICSVGRPDFFDSLNFGKFDLKSAQFQNFSSKFKILLASPSPGKSQNHRGDQRDLSTFEGRGSKKIFDFGPEILKLSRF